MKMKHRFFLLSLLLAALVLSAAFGSCDLSSFLTTPFSDTSWTFAHNGSWLEFTDTAWTWNERNLPGSIDRAEYTFRGAYTCTGQTATMTVTEYHKVGSGSAWVQAPEGMGWIATINVDTLEIEGEPSGTRQ